MKARKILALSMAIATAATASTAAFALEINQDSPVGNTEVTANIQAPGEVSYTITIPDKVDFGALTQPETDTDSFKDVNFTVSAIKVENLSDTDYVIIRVKNEGATVDDSAFYLTQKTSPNTKLTYDMYDRKRIDDFDIPLNKGKMVNPDGYYLVDFRHTGESKTGTLRLNQKQLYGKDISEIAGDYSGTIIFISSII